MLDESWVHFTKTGNILDYLKYKENENNLRAENNAKNNEGLSNKGTDHWGE
ncbi:MAG: hypothetical protein K2J55_01820 [Eubacterium sp.]|nr:hypothetical protein [Eubacterium sp.]